MLVPVPALRAHGNPRLGKETLVDTLIDFPIPDPRTRPRTVSTRTRQARERQWKKMLRGIEAPNEPPQRRPALISGSAGEQARPTTAGSMDPEDPA